MSGEFMETVEWNWASSHRQRDLYLHHIASLDDPAKADYDWQGEGVASCGLRAHFSIAGIMSRMYAERCPGCCDALGWPHGTGAPKNDDALRPLVLERRRTPTPDSGFSPSGTGETK